MPLTTSEPFQPPLAVQDVALVLDHASVELAPAATVIGFAVRVTVGAELAASVTVALAVLIWSAAETAVMITVALAGMADGAVYKPLLEIVPLVESPSVMPSTCHETAVLDVLETVAVNCAVFPSCKDIEAGEMLTAT